MHDALMQYYVAESCSLSSGKRLCIYVKSDGQEQWYCSDDRELLRTVKYKIY